MQESSSEIVSVPVGQLSGNPYNPNQMNLDSFDLLIRSIEQDGFTLPVVVNSGVTHPHLKDLIIDGEHRWRAAQVLNMPEVPVIYKDMDEAGMRASTIRHNKARGHHDALLESKVISELAVTMSAEELSQGLNIDAVELDVMLKKAKDYTSMEDLAALSEPDALETLSGRNVTGENAQIIATRYGMINSENALGEQNAAQLAQEKGQSVRVELIYHGEDAEFMRKFVSQHGSAHDTILFLVADR